MAVDSETLRRLHERVFQRYGSLISEKEYLSISELRHRVSPYTDFIRGLRDRLIHDIRPYDYPRHFFSAVQRAIEYIQRIENVELPFTFWFDFKDIDELKAAPLLDQALLLAALLRSLESNEVKVLLTRSQRPYVYFEWQGDRYLINPASGSLLQGDDTQTPFASDPVAYAFSDLFFESYEE